MSPPRFPLRGVALVFGLSYPSQFGEESPMNMQLQELLQRFDVAERSRDKIQHVLIGSPERIYEVTHLLHALRYADVGLWSPIVPMPGSELSMSVLTKYRSIN
jgi:hypothetical protein